MSNQTDLTEELREAVCRAYDRRTPVSIQGGGSKRFYGRPARGEPFPVAGHRGVVNYDPAELVLTARCGTPLREIEQCLREQGQMLAFEPPHFGPGATLGGTIACGIAGPRRPHAGAVRDYLLGARCLTGEGKQVRFGGEVMKNVAGFDAFRLMAGALGTLGVLLEVSLKVMPRPGRVMTLCFESGFQAAIAMMNDWRRQPLPITASCCDGTRVFARIEGSAAAIAEIHRRLGGEELPEGEGLWESVREQRHPYFSDNEALWRLSLPPSTPPLPIVGRWFMEWGGAQRWLKTALPPKLIRETAARAGGHATLFRGGEREGTVFHPLAPPLLELHKELKRAFDPRGILNPQRMYREF